MIFIVTEDGSSLKDSLVEDFAQESGLKLFKIQYYGRGRQDLRVGGFENVTIYPKADGTPPKIVYEKGGYAKFKATRRGLVAVIHESEENLNVLAANWHDNKWNILDPEVKEKVREMASKRGISDNQRKLLNDSKRMPEWLMDKKTESETEKTLKVIMEENKRLREEHEKLLASAPASAPAPPPKPDYEKWSHIELAKYLRSKGKNVPKTLKKEKILKMIQEVEEKEMKAAPVVT